MTITKVTAHGIETVVTIQCLYPGHFYRQREGDDWESVPAWRWRLGRWTRMEGDWLRIDRTAR